MLVPDLAGTKELLKADVVLQAVERVFLMFMAGQGPPKCIQC